MKMSKEKIGEIVRYLIVGVLTTVVSLGIYYGLVFTILDPNDATQLQLANIISWIGAVIFAYITNRIFVFKSQNTNKLKEATNFVGSRILTLLMDMAIMFIGVTWLKQNDKIVKLISQVLITIANYVLSKLFVFNSKKKEAKSLKKTNEKIVYAILWLIPIIDVIYSMFPYKEYTFWVLTIMKGSILIGFSIYLWCTKKSRKYLSIALGMIMVFTLYNYCKGYSFLTSLISIMEIIFLPIALLFFNSISNEKINHSFYAKIFFFYAFTFLIPFVFMKTDLTFSFYYAKKEMIGILICLLPITLNVLKNHKNYFTKFLGLLLIFAFIIIYQAPLLSIVAIITLLYFIWEERKNIFHKKVFLLSICIVLIGLSIYPIIYYTENFQELSERKISQIEHSNALFMKSNIDEQFFGIDQIYANEEIKTSIDLLDIFYSLGYLNIILYVILLSYSLSKAKTKNIYTLSFILTLIVSLISGHILQSMTISLFLASFQTASKNKIKPKILIVSNMYPSKKFKHYGSFVKNVGEELKKLGFQVDLAIKKKNISFPAKFIGYSWMYIQAIFKSIFYSYDYYYVHFVAQSTYSVLFGKVTGKTKLVCNIHGNDIVPDYDFEKKNVKRSKRVLPFADLVVAPSKYFEEVLINKYHIPKEKIKIYPSGGIDFTVFEEKDQKESQQRINLDPKYTYIGMVSRIEKNKGWDTLLEALNELKKESFMKNIKVIIVGTGQEQKEMDQMIKKFHLEDKIIQKEFVLQKDLVDYYNAFDVFVFPTKRKSESLGLVGLEAMACKTFVIACNLYGPKEYVIDNKNALTYQNVKNGKELASKIKKFMNMNEKEKEKILDEAYETAKKYDVIKLREKLINIFGTKKED